MVKVWKVFSKKQLRTSLGFLVHKSKVLNTGAVQFISESTLISNSDPERGETTEQPDTLFCKPICEFPTLSISLTHGVSERDEFSLKYRQRLAE